MSLFAKLSSYDERSARLAGIGLMLLSIFMFSFGDALGKFMVATYSVGQLLWLRACAAYAMGEMRLAKFAPILDQWATDGDPLLRATAMDAREKLRHAATADAGVDAL